MIITNSMKVWHTTLYGYQLSTKVTIMTPKSVLCSYANIILNMVYYKAEFITTSHDVYRWQLKVTVPHKT